MSVSNAARTMRQGTHKVSDGGGVSVTLTLDEGNLQWTMNQNYVEILDRGLLDGGQVTKGDEAPLELSFTARWKQLIAATVTGSGDPETLYELVMDDGDTYTSTNTTVGCAYTLQHQYTITDPCGTTGNGEIITFQYVYRTSFQCQEGDPNTLQFTGRDWETKPSIVRAS